MNRIAHYRIISALGEGGMGKVYKAFDEMLNREVAIKFLRSDAEADQKNLENFLHEARVAASINHPHVVKIYFCGLEGNQPYIVMELMKGKTLEDLLFERGRFPQPMALSIAIEAAKGLQAGYKSGLVHGDVHPANIFMDEQHGAKILDFGLARFASQHKSRNEGIFGAAVYLPPERVKRQQEDFRSDIFSLGATLYHILSGKRPYEDSDPIRLLEKRLTERPKALTDIVPEIHPQAWNLVARMMHPDPKKRHKSYEELIEELYYVLSRMVSRSSSSPVEQSARIKSVNQRIRLRKQKSWMIGVPVVVALVAAGVFAYPRISRSHNSLQAEFLIDEQPVELNFSSPDIYYWVHWGLNRASDFNHKKSDVRQISNVLMVGHGAVRRYTDGTMTNSWTDGEPVETITGCSSGIYVPGKDNGFELQLPLGTNPRELHLYAGVYRSMGKLELISSDSKSRPVTFTGHQYQTGVRNARVRVLYRADKDNLTMRVRWTVGHSFDSHNRGTVGLQAATLVPVSPPGLAPLQGQ